MHTIYLSIEVGPDLPVFPVADNFLPSSCARSFPPPGFVGPLPSNGFPLLPGTWHPTRDGEERALSGLLSPDGALLNRNYQLPRSDCRIPTPCPPLRLRAGEPPIIRTGVCLFCFRPPSDAPITDSLRTSMPTESLRISHSEIFLIYVWCRLAHAFNFLPPPPFPV